MTSASLCLLLFCLFTGAYAAEEAVNGPMEMSTVPTTSPQRETDVPATHVPVPHTEPPDPAGSASDSSGSSGGRETPDYAPVEYDECYNHPCGSSSVFDCFDPDSKQAGDFVCTCLHNSATRIGGTFLCDSEESNSSSLRTVETASTALVAVIIILCVCLMIAVCFARRKPTVRCKLAGHHHAALLPLLSLHGHHKKACSETASEGRGVSLDTQSYRTAESDSEGEGVPLTDMLIHSSFVSGDLPLPLDQVSNTSQSFSSSNKYLARFQSVPVPDGVTQIGI
ncbi:hypothetical protein DIPPA_55152 [Diplonema papillatum]|nr:hypothetical protein DIPPA_55152 [Diplonema papillatum]